MFSSIQSPIQKSLALLTAATMLSATVGTGCVSSGPERARNEATVRIIDSSTGWVIDEQNVTFDQLRRYEGPAFQVDGVDSTSPADVLTAGKIRLEQSKGVLELSREGNVISAKVRDQEGDLFTIDASWNDSFDVVDLKGPASAMRFELEGIGDESLARAAVGGLILGILGADPGAENPRGFWVPIIIGGGAIAVLLGYTYWSYSTCLDAATTACQQFRTECFMRCRTCTCSPECESTFIVQWKIKQNYVAEDCSPTPSPTASATPTATPTASPTAAPTASPTAAPTASPTATPGSP